MQGRPLVSPSDVRRLLPGLEDVPLPRGRWIRQRFNVDRVQDLGAAIAREFDRPGIGDTVRPGAEIALAVGSRGVARIAEITRAVVGEVRRRGARPFIIPAMGSHGGATAEGQKQILADYGITEAALGVEVRSSMEVVEVGRLHDGTPVYVDKFASQADGVIPINRVKPHTCFRGPVESGLAKMLAIGLGKHKGATTLHAHGFPKFATLIPAVAQLCLARVPILFGIAIVENARGDVAHLEAVPAGQILEREPQLLQLARQRMGRIFIDRFDVLVVDEVGKDISGDGMDPNVTGRFAEPSVPGGDPAVQKIVVLGLTERTHGNASGIGTADVITQAVLDAIDFTATYTNVATSRLLTAGRIPVVMPTAADAVRLAIATLNGVEPERVTLVRIKNTLHLERIWVSEPLWQALSGRWGVDFEPLSGPEEMQL